MKSPPCRLRALMVVAISVLVVQRAPAATNTWSGPSGGDWLTPGNWTPGGPPGANDEARFLTPARWQTRP